MDAGSPQGGSASPLLANIYLHYVFDLWIQAWRRKRLHGDVIVVRYADDIVVGFERKDEAERLWAELKERMQKFQLELHPEKTRLFEFGRHAAANRKRLGLGKPERCFLGPATGLLVLSLLLGCSKKPEQTATTASSENQSAATQPDADGAVPDSNASNSGSPSSTTAPAAMSRNHS